MFPPSPFIEPESGRAIAAKLVPLPVSFYQVSAAKVAPELLGHYLLRNTPEGPCGGIIVEGEAYLANDPACHGFRGKTARNQSMYGPPGRAYVYFIYGNHFCFNAVCQPRDVAEAVLIRAIEPLLGEDLLRKNRLVSRSIDLTNGPGKLCQALQINRSLDGVDLTDPVSPVYVAWNPDFRRFRRQRSPIIISPRIGIAAAAELPLRFYLDGSPCVSRRRHHSVSKKLDGMLADS